MLQMVVQRVLIQTILVLMNFLMKAYCLLHFLILEVKIKNNQALLTWSTANEINNKGFEVELSRDNKTFSSIGFVAAVKTSTGINNYSFTDNKLLSGSNYYRLKQVDNDGASRYSSVVKLDFSKFAWSYIW